MPIMNIQCIHCAFNVDHVGQSVDQHILLQFQVDPHQEDLTVIQVKKTEESILEGDPFGSDSPTKRIFNNVVRAVGPGGTLVTL